MTGGRVLWLFVWSPKVPRHLSGDEAVLTDIFSSALSPNSSLYRRQRRRDLAKTSPRPNGHLNNVVLVGDVARGDRWIYTAQPGKGERLSGVSSPLYRHGRAGHVTSQTNNDLIYVSRTTPCGFTPLFCLLTRQTDCEPG